MRCSNVRACMCVMVVYLPEDVCWNAACSSAHSELKNNNNNNANDWFCVCQKITSSITALAKDDVNSNRCYDERSEKLYLYKCISMDFSREWKILHAPLRDENRIHGFNEINVQILTTNTTGRFEQKSKRKSNKRKQWIKSIERASTPIQWTNRNMLFSVCTKLLFFFQSFALCQGLGNCVDVYIHRSKHVAVIFFCVCMVFVEKGTRSHQRSAYHTKEKAHSHAKLPVTVAWFCTFRFLKNLIYTIAHAFAYRYNRYHTYWLVNMRKHLKFLNLSGKMPESRSGNNHNLHYKLRYGSEAQRIKR